MDSKKTYGNWLQSNCSVAIVFYHPSVSVLMCRCVISWQLTLVSLVDAYSFALQFEMNEFAIHPSFLFDEKLRRGGSEGFFSQRAERDCLHPNDQGNCLWMVWWLFLQITV